MPQCVTVSEERWCHSLSLSQRSSGATVCHCIRGALVPQFVTVLEELWCHRVRGALVPQCVTVSEEL